TAGRMRNRMSVRCESWVRSAHVGSLSASTVGNVRAVNAGPDREREVTAERRRAVGDATERVGHAPLDVHAGALGGGAGPPAAAAETDGARELCGERVELVLGAGRARIVAARLGVLDGLAEVVDPRSVACARRLVEELAGVAAVDGAVARGQIEDVELAAG